MENDVSATAFFCADHEGRARQPDAGPGRLPGHGRTGDALPAAQFEKTDQTGHMRDVALGQRWMDAMSVDYSCLFPTGMPQYRAASPEGDGGRPVLGLQPLGHRKRCCRNRKGRFYTMLSLPISDPDAALRHVETFRRPPRRRRVHGHHGAHDPGARQTR